MDQAIASATRATQLDLTWSLAHVILGRAHLANHDWRQATGAGPWAAHRFGLLLVAVAAGTVLRLADAPAGARAITGLASAAIAVVLITQLAGDAKRAARRRTSDTRALLGAAGELAERTRPTPSLGAGQRPGISSRGGGRTGPSA